MKGMSMKEQQLVQAYHDYTAALRDYERAHPFDLLTAMDRPAPPAQSIAARAGEMIHARGLAGALAVALMDSLSRDILYQDILSQVYTELAMAAVE
jgi:hypothetical protein